MGSLCEFLCSEVDDSQCSAPTQREMDLDLCQHLLRGEVIVEVLCSGTEGPWGPLCFRTMGDRASASCARASSALSLTAPTSAALFGRNLRALQGQFTHRPGRPARCEECSGPITASTGSTGRPVLELRGFCKLSAKLVSLV